MAIIEDSPRAFGGPGIPPRWTRSAKDIAGTAYSIQSRVWYTISKGVLNEIYYPQIDLPQVRDLQFLVSDGETFFHEERRDMDATTEYLDGAGLGVRVITADREGRYRLIKEIITDPHQPCVLIDLKVEGDPDFLARMRLYVLLAPHLGVGGWGNNGNAAKIAGYEFLTANKDGIWLALGSTSGFLARSCGYVGTTDGWQDLSSNFQLDYQFAAAPDGNIALIGQLDLSQTRMFTVGLGFGRTLHRATTSLFQSLNEPFGTHRARFIQQWKRACDHFLPLGRFSGDGGKLYRRSAELLLAHEDKTYAGAMIASLSIPWGEAKGDEDLGGYHLVWTRDMVNSVTGLLAGGDSVTALRALIYLACSQREDGGFPQNFWIDGQPYWSGVQLDEVSFPIMLAWRLERSGSLGGFDPYPMVKMAARFLIANGPVTPQERWEENCGYSPSTLAANIAALICAAHMARDRGDNRTASYIEDYADFLETHIERWTLTNAGVLVPAIKRHYVRINPVDPSDPEANEDLDRARVAIKNRPPGTPCDFPAAEIVDAGFLELVRYGIRKPGDRLIEDSLEVIDAVLRADFPAGPCWRRYTHDGYGQHDDGGPYVGWGRGRPWPLLTGERGHYELAAGRDVKKYIRAMEGFANQTQLLPEQIWDRPDIPAQLLYFGKQTGSATPLMWAHAEYIKLLRSAADGRVFDLLPEVADRYLSGPPRTPIEIWKPNRHLTSVKAPVKLRIQAPNSFALHWTRNGWSTATDTAATPTSIGIYYVDLEIRAGDSAPVTFTFFWRDDEKWEGRDYTIEIQH